MAIDLQPGDGVLHDRRHSREVANLPGVTPRKERQPAALAFGIDDGEAASCRKVSPPSDVRARAHAAPVRRDYEWDRRMLLRPVPGRQDQVRPPRETVVS